MLMSGNSNSQFLSHNTADEVSLYFHIPFCTHKCAYCHFYVIPDKEPFKQQLIKGLSVEWERSLPLLQGKTISTIYFGGGTPALFGAEAIGEILSWIRHSVSMADMSLSADAEITLEANPENITRDLMEAYRLVGINRISIGIQTLDDELLKVLQRIHGSKKALDAVFLTAEAGISNISVDLMYDLPGQTEKSWKNTLEGIVRLPISHLSLYNLTIEPHTLFFKNKEILAKKIPNEEESLKMYEMAVEELESHGLARYEISAFAKPGYYSRHNVGYWTGRSFLGLGPSAFSYWEGKRFRNVANLSRYTKSLCAGDSPVDFEEELSPFSHVREMLAIQLRLLSGVDLNFFQKIHGTFDDETKQTLVKLETEGLLERINNQIQLTKKGILFYDTVAVELI